MKRNPKQYLLIALSAMFLSTFHKDSFADDLPMAKPDEVGMSAENLKRVDEIVSDLIEKKRIAGASVMVARKGKICFFETYGMADVERDKAMSKESIFRIYSMSQSDHDSRSHAIGRTRQSFAARSNWKVHSRSQGDDRFH